MTSILKGNNDNDNNNNNNDNNNNNNNNNNNKKASIPHIETGGFKTHIEENSNIAPQTHPLR